MIFYFSLSYCSEKGALTESGAPHFSYSSWLAASQGPPISGFSVLALGTLFGHLFAWVLGIQALYQASHFSCATKALVSVLNTSKVINMWDDEYVN